MNIHAIVLNEAYGQFNIYHCPGLNASLHLVTDLDWTLFKPQYEYHRKESPMFKLFYGVRHQCLIREGVDGNIY
jgi:hypothetical protein